MTLFATTTGGILNRLGSLRGLAVTAIILIVPIGGAVRADVQVQCQMGSSCIYQKVLSKDIVQRDAKTTVINARLRSCFKDHGPWNEKTGRYPTPSHYSCQPDDDLNTNYVVASCNVNAPFVGGYDAKDDKWHLRQVVVGTKHVVPDFVSYFMICHDYDGKRDVEVFAKKLGYKIPEQAEWQEKRPANINETGQEERVYTNLDELASDARKKNEKPAPELLDDVPDGAPIDVTDLKIMLGGDWYEPGSQSQINFEMRPNLTVRETYSHDGGECFYANFDPVPYSN